jgi:putative peptidoglycan lipid II flippase
VTSAPEPDASTADAGTAVEGTAVEGTAVEAAVAEVDEAVRESQAGDLAANPPSAAGSALARNSAVMASGTIVSRVTGVLRDVAMTAALGFYLVSDAYSLGNSLPNILYILVVWVEH